MHAYQPERLNAPTKLKNPFLEIMSAYPGLFAGAALSVVVTTAVFVNAVWYQPGKHPSPLFATRAIEKAIPIQQPTKVAIVTPRPDVPVKKAEVNPAVVNEASAEILREVQTGLSVRGYYEGKLDGVYGSRTEKAINSFQKDHSLKQDGKASVRLLTQILMSASAKPQEVPVPKTTKIVEAPKPKIQNKEKVAENKPVDQADGLVARIQSGLKAYGYDDLVVDGKMGQQTATAIQRFQLDYGMKITGEPSDSVLGKLKEIGAYKQG